METLRARHTGEKSIYIHNDLAGASFYFKNRIEERLKAEDTKGIAFEYMSCLTMLAFELEAKINFLGYKLIDGWEERKPYVDKFNTVLGHLGIKVDWTQRPFLSAQSVKKFRDEIAHGKPIEQDFDEILEGAANEIDRAIDLNGTWEKQCSYENVFQIYEDVNAIWIELLTKSKIEIYETLTRGSSGLIVLEKIIKK